MVDQEIEGPLGMGLEVLQLQREGAFEAIDVVPVLDLVEAILRLPLVVVPLPRGGDLRLVGPRMAVDGQERVHGAGDRDQGLLDLARRGEGRDGGLHVRNADARGVVVVLEPGAVHLVGRVELLLPLTGRHLPESIPVDQP